METLQSLSILLGSSWASGINLYLAVAGLGISHRMELITLPGNMDSISHPAVIGVAIFMYAIEFFADKIPYVDSAWDTVHTAIRPIGGFTLGYMAMSGSPDTVQIPVALLAGSVALDAHLTKATSRAAINTSPEPVSNSVASVTEDVSVLGMIYVMIHHPVVASILVIAFIIFSIWFLKKMFKFVKWVFSGKSSHKTNKK